MYDIMDENDLVALSVAKGAGEQLESVDGSRRIPTDKKISISGTSNRYQIKKLISDSNTIIKKRKETENWDIPDELFLEEKQHDIVSSVYNNVAHDNWIKYNYICDNYITNPIYLKVILGQIERKIASYKQQDVLKKRYCDTQFITLAEVIHKLHECKLQCYYCVNKIFILYEISREQKQWTLDRINNDIGHNNDNVLISCLECNLKRRKTNKDAFLFTKQLKIIKGE